MFDFDQNLDLLLDQSDLCITRAGASSLAEIAILNIPFIAIPYHHQRIIINLKMLSITKIKIVVGL